jgi:hypothetical protein
MKNMQGGMQSNPTLVSATDHPKIQDTEISRLSNRKEFISNANPGGNNDDNISAAGGLDIPLQGLGNKPEVGYAADIAAISPNKGFQGTPYMSNPGYN